MPKCSFCGETIRKGTGKMFVHTDGRIAYFCSSKCEKNTRKLKRNPAKTAWTRKYQDLKKSSGSAQKEAKKEQKQEKPAKEEKKKQEKK